MKRFQIVASIVVFKNDITKLNKAISSFLNTGLLVKLVIIDNSPTPEIKNSLPHDNRVQYIFNNANIGFGAAHNLNIAYYIDKCEYYLVLNPDVYFYEGVLENIFDFMNRNTQIGLIMPKILFPDGSIQNLPKLIPHPLDLLVRRISLLNRIFSKRLQNYELRIFSDYTTFDAPVISGCFSFFRTETIKKVGIYDERFFMYFEDFDLSRRINSEWRTVYYSDVSVFHEYERGAGKKLILFKIFIQSAVKYFNKWGWFRDKERTITNSSTLDRVIMSNKDKKKNDSLDK